MPFNYREGDEPVPGYRLVRFLGKGAIGEVWQATGPGGTEAALKMIDLSGSSTHARKEFRALQLVKRIHHPNLVPVIAAWAKAADGTVLTDTDAVQLASHQTAPPVMQDTMVLPPSGSGPLPKELIIAMGLGHQSLADRLNECRQLGMSGVPFDELLGYMEDAAKAIDFLNSPVHQTEAGMGAIGHCDIKPLNMLIVGGAVQVCDFGLAHIVGAVRSTAAAMGTIAYVAPELLDGKPSPATDQYCLAVSYYELLTGSLPYAQETATAVMRAVLEGDLDFSKVPEAEQAVLRKATAKSPGDRYHSATEMVHAIARARRPSFPSPQLPPPPRRRGRRIKVAILSTLAVVLVAAAAMAVVLLLKSQDSWVEEKAWPQLRDVAESDGYKEAFKQLARSLSIAPSQGEGERLTNKLLDKFLAAVDALRSQDKFRRAAELLEEAPASLVPEKEKEARIAELIEGWKTRVLALVDSDRREAILLLRDPPDPPPHGDACKQWAGYVLAVLESWDKGEYAKAVDPLGEEMSFVSAEQRLRLRGAVVAAWGQQIRAIPADTPEQWRDLFKTFGDFSTHANQRDDECVIRDEVRGQLADRLAKDAERRGIDDTLKNWLALLKEAPGALAEDAKLAACRKNLLDRWVQQVSDRIKDKKFDAAWTDLSYVPADSSDGQTATLTALLRKEWSQYFRSVLKKSIADAERLLSPAPKWIDAKLEQSLRQDIADFKTGEAIARWHSRLAQSTDAKGFHEALALLDDPPPGLGGAEVKERRDQIRSDWLKYAISLWDSGTPDAVNDCVACVVALLADFPDCHEARLLYARALIKRKNYRLAPGELTEELTKIPKDVQAKNRRLWEGLTLIAEAMSLAEDALQKRLAEVWSLPSLPGAWDLDDGEIAALKGFTKPPPVPPKVQMDKVQALLAKVEELVKKGEFDGAAEQLSNAEANDPAGRSANQIAKWKRTLAISLLSAPGARANEIAKGLELAADLQNGPETLELCKAISKAMGNSKLPDARLIDLAIPVVRSAYAAFGANAEIAQEFKGLWERRLWLYVESGEMPSPDGKAFKDCDSDRQRLDLGSDLLAVWYAWRYECCLKAGAADKSVQDDALNAGAVKDPYVHYVHYVRAVVLRAMDNPKWEVVIGELAYVFPLAQPVPALQKTDRLGKAADLAVQAIDESRWKRPRAAKFGDPFSDADYRLLAGVHDCRLNLNAELLDKLKLFLGMAAVRHPKAAPDVARARTLTAELLGGGNLKEEDLLPVLAAYVQASLPVPPGSQLPPDVLKYCTQLFSAYAEHVAKAPNRAPNEQDAKILCEQIFRPVCEMADKVNAAQTAQADRARWEQFYAAAGRLFWEHQSVIPSETDVNELVEKMFSRAIDFSPDVADNAGPTEAAKSLAGYYLTRGEARLRRTTPVLADVIKDAEKALTLIPNQPKANALLANARLRQSRELSRDDRIKYLTQAVEAAQKAIKDCPKNDASFANFQLCLSMAYLERANYERDREQAEKDLKDARACVVVMQANPALNLGNLSAAYPYLALGNAYEDLGFMLYDEPEENYQRAIEAFQKADNAAEFGSQASQRKKEQAVASCSVGRVYFRSAWQTWIPPQDPKTDLGKMTVDQRKEECIGCLRRAIRDDPQCLEAYYYLARAIQLQEGPKAAERYYVEAKTRSENDPSHGTYLQLWALLPLASEQADEAWKRAEELGKAPPSPAAAFDPLKAKAFVRASVHWSKKEFDKAKAECDGCLPKDEKLDDLCDVALLLMRADCNIELATKGRDKALAEEAIRDARRADQAALTFDRESRFKARRLEAEGYRRLVVYSKPAKDQASLNKALEAYRSAVEFAVPLVEPQTLVLAEQCLQIGGDRLLADELTSMKGAAQLPVYERLIEWLTWHRKFLRQRRGDETKVAATLAECLTRGIECAKEAKNTGLADAWEKMLEKLKKPDGLPAQPAKDE